MEGVRGKRGHHEGQKKQSQPISLSFSWACDTPYSAQFLYFAPQSDLSSLTMLFPSNFIASHHGMGKIPVSLARHTRRCRIWSSFPAFLSFFFIQYFLSPFHLPLHYGSSELLAILGATVPFHTSQALHRLVPKPGRISHFPSPPCSVAIIHAQNEHHCICEVLPEFSPT